MTNNMIMGNSNPNPMIGNYPHHPQGMMPGMMPMGVPMGMGMGMGMPMGMNPAMQMMPMGMPMGMNPMNQYQYAPQQAPGMGMPMWMGMPEGVNPMMGNQMWMQGGDGSMHNMGGWTGDPNWHNG